MSVKIMSEIFENETLGPTERLIMLALADHADDAGRCYPSIARLAKRTGLKDRAIQGNLKRLSDAGYVTITPRAGPNGVNLFLVRPDPAAYAPQQQMHPARNAPSTKCTTPPHLVRPDPAADAPKPSRTIKEPSESNARRVLCEILSEEVADAYIQHRKAKRAKLTDHAAQLIARKLEGHPDPNTVVEESIANGWTGVFPERGRSPPPFSPPPPRIRARPPSEYEQ